MDESNGLAVAAVRLYAAELRRVRHRLLGDFPQFGNVLDLMSAVRSARTLPREGASSSGIRWTVHGAGCRMTDERGVEVDVDLVNDAEVFDAYRVQSFYEERRGVRISIPDLKAACSYLAGLHELEQVQQSRWYAVPVERS